MSENIFENRDMILTKYCGPKGTIGYQITTKRGNCKLQWNTERYISINIERC